MSTLIDLYFFLGFPGVLHPLLMCKHVNYLWGWVCVSKHIYFSSNILKSHTILLSSANIYYGTNSLISTGYYSSLHSLMLNCAYIFQAGVWPPAGQTLFICSSF